jgi:2-haloacid dehalogenase
MVAEARGVRLTPADRDSILGGTRALPPHGDVRPALERLRTEGFRLVTLTNSAISSSGPVDAVKRFKPAPEPYRHVAQELGVGIRDLRMVAAHAWDVLGALQVGCVAAFVARPGKVLYPLGPRPGIVAPDFSILSTQILARDPNAEALPNTGDFRGVVDYPIVSSGKTHVTATKTARRALNVDDESPGGSV